MLMTPKVMLVTGGAKRIGATTAQYFHQLGWNIVAALPSI